MIQGETVNPQYFSAKARFRSAIAFFALKPIAKNVKSADKTVSVFHHF